MFDDVFADAKLRKLKEESLNTFRATEINSKVRRDNPTMIEQNHTLVDFSNPESVARMTQYPVINPYGYNTMAANPNIIPSSNGYPTYGYNYNYGNNWGGFNSGYATAADTAKFMIPLPGDTRIPCGQLVTKEEAEARAKADKAEYSNPRDGKLIVELVPVTVSEKSKKPRILTKIIKPKHVPHTPYTIEELNPDLYTIRYIEQTPLHLDADDRKRVTEVCDKIYEYNKALAFGVLEMIMEDEDFKSYSRQKFEKLLICLNNTVAEYQKRSNNIRIVDYKAPYRYRPTPIFSIDEEGNYVIPIQLDPVAKRTKDELIKDWVYDYDRGRDWLTEEEWTVFKLKAMSDLERDMKRLEEAEFLSLNPQFDESKKQTEEVNLPEYNPYDPVSVKLHKQYKAEHAYKVNKDFWRYILRHKLDDVQFENWWYGTSTANQMRFNQQKLTQEEEHRRWAKAMNAQHLRLLNNAVPIDRERSVNECRRQILKALDDYNCGMVRPDMSLQDYMKVIGYLGGNKIHELNIQKQREEDLAYQQKRISHDVYRKTMIEYFNNFPGEPNPNPNYTPHYGTVDPRYGFPSHYVDMTNTPERRALKEKVREAVRNTTRHQRLHVFYD